MQYSTFFEEPLFTGKICTGFFCPYFSGILHTIWEHQEKFQNLVISHFFYRLSKRRAHCAFFFWAQTGDPYKFSYKSALQILWKFSLYASRKYLQFSLRVSARVESTYKYAQFQLDHSTFLSNQLSSGIELN